MPYCLTTNPCVISPITFSKATGKQWQKYYQTGWKSRLQYRSDYLGTAGHQWTACFFPTHTPGHKLVPCDFLAAANSHYKLPGHHDILISNFLAQPEALMNGLTAEEVKNKLTPTEQADPVLVASKVFDGNKPSNSFLLIKWHPKPWARYWHFTT